jgi:cell wall-associated NlpC family hydrolase
MNLSSFIGIPYLDHGRDRRGCDCWGLVHLVYEEMRGITLPDYRALYGHADNQVETSALFGMAAAGQIAGAFWHLVPPEDWQPLDVALIRIGRLHSHVGLIAGNGLFLHCLKGRACTLEPIDSFHWGSAIKGGFRWTAQPI